jgi:hypothetical protein
MRARHLTTAVTLLALLAILVVGFVVGGKSLLAPLPGSNPANKASAACDTKAVKRGQRITAAQVEVSVFNAGTRSGLADDTLAKLAKRGFKKGDVGNAPDGTHVIRAQVWTTRRHDAAARLVAEQFGPATKVAFKDSDLGPGVDVVVGNNLHHLNKLAKRAIVARRPSAVCQPSS